MEEMKIKDYIQKELSLDDQKIALNFVDWLENKNLNFYKDNSDCWKNKTYYHIKFKDKCICFISIKDSDEPNNMWTIWSDNSKVFENADIDDEIKRVAYQHIDYCCNCGSCGGGKRKIIFGKNFDGVCSCTFRIDNPTVNDLPFLQKMIELSLELP